MLRPLDVAMIAALIAAGSWTFKVKHDSELAMQRVGELERAIAAEREAIDILRSDWALLTSPDRLQRLVERHGGELKLTPLDPERIVRIDDIPLKTPATAPGDGTPDNGFAGRLQPRLDTDLDTITGTIAAPAENAEGTR